MYNGLNEYCCKKTKGKLQSKKNEGEKGRNGG